MDKRVRKVLNDFIQKFAALFLVIAMSLTPCITGMGQVFADEPEGDGDVTYGLDIKESEHGKVEIKDSDQTSFKENDEGQTVKLVAPTKEAVKKTENKTTIPKNTGIVQTGDSYRMYVLAAGAVVLVVVGGFVFFKKNKKKDNKK